MEAARFLQFVLVGCFVADFNFKVKFVLQEMKYLLGLQILIKF